MDLCLLEHQMDAFGYVSYISISVTRKYPLCGYILGVLTHTTAWYGHCMKVRFAHFSSGVYVSALSYVGLKE